MRLSPVSTAAPMTRQSACRVIGPEHASKRRGFCGRCRVASSQVRPCKLGYLSGGVRFLQTDPVPGGSANAYDYAAQDPVNQVDLNGDCWWGCHLWRAIKKHAKVIMQVATLASVAVCIGATFGVCAAATVAALAVRVTARAAAQGWRRSAWADVEDVGVTAVSLGYGRLISSNTGALSFRLRLLMRVHNQIPKLVSFAGMRWG